MRESTKKRYKDAVMDMYIKSRENGGTLTQTEGSRIIRNRRTDNRLMTAMVDAGYMKNVSTGIWQLTQPFNDVDVAKINKVIKERWRISKQSKIPSHKTVSKVLTYQLTKDQLRDAARAFIDGGDFHITISSDEIKNRIIKLIENL